MYEITFCRGKYYHKIPSSGECTGCDFEHPDGCSGDVEADCFGGASPTNILIEVKEKPDEQRSY
jgi:hypothetical protein